MSNQPKRRRSERLAAYDEQDGDFHFTRGTKRVKKAQAESIPEDDELASTPEPAPTRTRASARTSKPAPAQIIVPSPLSAVAPKKVGKAKKNQTKKQDAEAPVETQPLPKKRVSKKESSRAATQEEEAVSATSSTKRGPSPNTYATRESVKKASRRAPSRAAAEEGHEAVSAPSSTEREPSPETRATREPTQRVSKRVPSRAATQKGEVVSAPSSTNRRASPNTHATREGPKRASKRAPSRAAAQEGQEVVSASSSTERGRSPNPRATRNRAEDARRTVAPNATPSSDGPLDTVAKSRMTSTPKPAESEIAGDKGTGSKKIMLPFSDTPIQSRNKEMRRKTGGRRSSLGMRGRRASSLIENGHSAIPHREVQSAEFYKHIEAEGPSEPRRMKQLLTWCGERSLIDKPPLGSRDVNAIHGARAIQDQLQKDFGLRSEFSDWFSRDEVPKPPAIEQPNPKNTEHDEKIADLEQRIQRLKLEKKTWLSLKKPPPEAPPLFPPDSSLHEKQPLPDSSLLDPEEARILGSLTDVTTSFAQARNRTLSRIRDIQSSLEFKVEHLTESVHTVERRVSTASNQADRVLALSAARLKEREESELRAAGTKQMPVMEVLRSLAGMLPDGG